MTVSGDPLSGQISGNFQPRVGLGSTFPGSRLDASRPVTNAQLSDQIEQKVDRGVATITQASRGPLAPQLHRMFEAQMTWVHACGDRSLRHEQTNQVVG